MKAQPACSLQTLVVCAGAFCLPLNLAAHPAADEMAEAAHGFLAALTPGQKAKAVDGFENKARKQWHFVPTESLASGRKGVPFLELNESQRALGLALLRTGLSGQGYQKASDIMSLEGVLKVIEKPGGNADRNPAKYFISIYGSPDAKGTWAWRFEGHHCSLSFTIVDGKAIAGTPSFMGSNPAEVREGSSKGMRVLAREEDLARKLVKSLSPEQQAVAVFDANAPKDILTMNETQVSPLAPAGLGFDKLDATKQSLLRQVVEEYVNRMRPDLARGDLEEISKAGWDKITFAWAGGTERGHGHYYRVQGPTFLLEYDNTQNGANHVHSVWRKFNGDFGADLLRSHLTEEHGAK
jgi:Protein of unknown function (DUF3500)